MLEDDQIENVPDTSLSRGLLAPMLCSAGLSLAFAVGAIVLQDGSTSGASISFLFITVGLGILLGLGGIGALGFSRHNTAMELIGFALILPSTFLLVLFLVRIVTGE